MSQAVGPRQLLEWYLEAGVDEAIGEAPLDRTAAPPPPPPPPESPAPGSPPPESPAPEASASRRPAPPPAPAQPARRPAPDGEALGNACALAAGAATIDDLRRALEGFDGCPLSKTATNLVLGDGNPEARIMLIGEAPGAEEDRRGLPFVGPSGRLLDRMLASIGLDRTGFYISNTVFWRPPGNRTPTTFEMAVCMPFVERLIELVDPRILIALGGPAAKSLLARSEAVGRLRGHWYPYSTPRLARPIEAAVMYHPAYLLRTAAQKRAAWQDLLAIKAKLETL